MMHVQKTEPMLSSLKGFFWLSLFELLYSSSGIFSQEITNISAREGDEARLPCGYKISEGKTLESYYIYWQKPISGKPDLVVISYKHGKESESEKDILYKNRTKMDKHNLTLSISPVKLSDTGIYKCIAILKNYEGEGAANLSVIAPFSKPIIKYNSSRNLCDPTELTLSCVSHGGSSWPKMYGFVNNKAVHWTSVVAYNNDSKLFNITGTLQLNVTENMLVQCSVGFSDFQVSTNDSLNMTMECSKPTLPPWTSPPFGIIISSSVILIFLLVVIMLVTHLYYFRNRPRPSTTHQPLATDEMVLQDLSNGQTPSGLRRSPL
ncbi:T-lymphocyte activation antigen CD80-like [Python bivittatus]|uniref:T-lymphocyte activation antigen CD80-like n=1 Tax=Python bivittatus TaxID=176946 RepID=A0A9F2QWL8_PYTBI|nr:T-lymphocyte activation antigen CD80-like [Python bivittatus]